MAAFARTSTHYRFLRSDISEEEVLPALDALQSLRVDGLLRMVAAEHQRAQDRGSFWYFNLGPSTHRVGARYALVEIMRPGRRADSGLPEVLPLLAWNSSPCVMVAREVRRLASPLEPTLPMEMLNDSLLCAPTMDALVKSLWARYAPAWPGKSADQLWSLGLAATHLVRDQSRPRGRAKRLIDR